ncbi:histidine kinase [Actinocatenispora sera]|uniref:sensor histidine kinase n=1 Tax=Actinocatenispora sera TaxID=390989 RepID=UPI0033FA6C6E
MNWLARLARRVDAVEARSLARSRDKLRNGTDRGPDGKIGRAGIVVWLALLVFPLIVAVLDGQWLAAVGVIAMGATMTVAMRLPPTGLSQLTRYLLLLPLLALALALGRTIPGSGGLLVVLPAQAAAMILPMVVPAFLGVLAVSSLVIVVLGGHGGLDYVTIALAAWMSGLVMFIMRRFFTTIGLLREAREELARSAVADERVRFARDLHDLLGHTLSVIVVKAQVVRRLVYRDAAKAAAAAADIETIGRQALVEVREAVTGYRQRGLAAELDGARAALADAGITATVRRAAGDPDEAADALLGWAVREATTNVIRHSAATHCTISLRYADDRAILQVADDGTGAGSPGPDGASGPPTAAARFEPLGGMGGGNGLRGLAERFGAAGGTVHTAAGRHGFTLTATVPVTVGRMDE